VNAGLVRSPKDWPWSSYRHYAFGEPNPLIDDAAEYIALGSTGPQRRKAYQAFFAVPLATKLDDERKELVDASFIGDAAWIAERLRGVGVSLAREVPDG